MKLGDVMKLSKNNLISIEDEKEYIIAGVQNYGAGIVNRRKVRGYELTMKKYQLIKPNQLMWCKVDTKNGAFGITKNHHINSLASTNMALADIDLSKCYPEFIEYLFRITYFHEQITKASSGTTNRKYLTPTQLFENIEIPNFDKSEQLKWLEKVNSILNSKLSSELTYQLYLVKKLRQQLLQDALQGKLLPQDENDEPATELLKKIMAEKTKQIVDKKLKKEKELPPIKPEEIPFEIPDNWVWCRLGEAGILRRGKSKHRPRNDVSLFENGTYPFIQTGDVARSKASGYVIETTNGYYNEFGLSQSVLKNKGTLCITIAANIAECGFLGFDACAPDSIVSFKSIHNIIEKYCFYYIIQAREYIEKYAPATAQKNINLEILNALLIPVPPLSEQNRIVQKLDELMKYCDDLEAGIKESESQNEKLLQQVLREALRKELVD